MKKFLFVKFLIFLAAFGFAKGETTVIDEEETTPKLSTATESTLTDDKEEVTTTEASRNTDFRTTTLDDETTAAWNPTEDPNACYYEKHEICWMRDSFYQLSLDNHELHRKIFTLQDQLDYQTRKVSNLVILLSLASLCIVIASLGILGYVTNLNKRLMKQEEEMKRLMSQGNVKHASVYAYY